MATIRDVAREANVSPSTVSLVLNNRGSISRQTERRVHEAVERMAYRPQRQGRPIQKVIEKGHSKTLNIAVVCAQPVVFNGVVCTLSRQWLTAIRREVVGSRHVLSVFTGVRHVSEDFMFQQVVDAREIDGVILIGIEEGDGYLQRVLDARLPVVVINRKPMYDEFSYVGIDEYGGGRHVMDYLVGLNHKRIALIMHEATHDGRPYWRDGALAGLRNHDMDFVCVQQFPFRSGGYTHVEILTEACHAVRDSGATAVYILGDNLAAQCIDIWTEMGVSIPGELSVVGTDDVGPAANCGLLPSSVGFDKRLIGEKAVQILLESMDSTNPSQSQGHIVKTYIVEHDTTGPAPRESVVNE